jgi:hypothetical protein
MTAALSPVARALLAWLQERPAAGEGSLKTWGQTRRPQLTLTQVEVRAAELVEANLATREVKADGRAIYRARERSPEPPPVEVVTEPSPTPPPASVTKPKKAAKNPVSQKVICGGCGKLDVCNGDPSCPSCADSTLRNARETGAKLAAVVVDREEEIARLAEALLSWERQWGWDGTDLAAMEARIEEAETRLAQVTAERDQLAAAMANANATPAPAPAEPALSALARLPVEQRRLVGLALQELSIEALGGALGAARAEAFAARPDLGPRLSENAAAVLEVLSPDRGQTPREIGKKVQVNQNSVHTALRSLEKHGLATNATYGFWRRAS